MLASHNSEYVVRTFKSMAEYQLIRKCAIRESHSRRLTECLQQQQQTLHDES